MNPFADLLSALCGDAGLSLLSAFSGLREWQKLFVKNAIPIEQDQQIRWFTSVWQILREQNLTFPAVVKYEEHIISKARETIARHRFSFSGGIVRAYRIAVVGPPKSGKSAFLSILGKQALAEILASGDWKRTFIVAMDMARIIPLIPDLATLFQAVVQLTFQALGAQLPVFLPHAAGVIAAFESIVRGTPLLPKSFVFSEDFHSIVPELRRLLALFAAYWNDRGALEQFLLSTFGLPVSIGAIFGFPRSLLIVDHADLADLTVGPIPPFDDTSLNVFVIEIVKFMLASSSFIVSCRDSNAILNLFPAISDTYGIDLTDGLTFASTLDVVPAATGDRPVVVSFEGDGPQISLDVHHFGGCAAYLQSWAEINRFADEADDAARTGGDVEEPRLFLKGLVDATVRRLLVGVDGAPLPWKVRSATRVSPRV
jgi:hypothetical protein